MKNPRVIAVVSIFATIIIAAGVFWSVKNMQRPPAPAPSTVTQQDTQAPTNVLQQPIAAGKPTTVESVRYHKPEPILKEVTAISKKNDSNWTFSIKFMSIGTVTGGRYDGTLIDAYAKYDDGHCLDNTLRVYLTCGSEGPFRYILDKTNTTITYLPKISEVSDANIELSDVNIPSLVPFQQLNLTLKTDAAYSIPALEHPQTIYGPGSRQILSFIEASRGTLDNKLLVKIFTDPVLGDVYATRYGSADSVVQNDSNYAFLWNDFYVFHPDDTYLIYSATPDFDVKDVVWDDHREGGAAYTYSSMTVCDPYMDSVEVLNSKVAMADLVKTGTVGKPGDSIYGFKRVKNPFADAMYEQYTSHADHPVSRAAFDKSHPLFVWVDPFERMVLFKDIKFIPPAECRSVAHY